MGPRPKWRWITRKSNIASQGSTSGRHVKPTCNVDKTQTAFSTKLETLRHCSVYCVNSVLFEKTSAQSFDELNRENIIRAGNHVFEIGVFFCSL